MMSEQPKVNRMVQIATFSDDGFGTEIFDIENGQVTKALYFFMGGLVSDGTIAESIQAMVY